MTSNTLLEAPGGSRRDRTACVHLVEREVSGPYHLIVVSFAQSATERVEFLRSRLSPTPERICVVGEDGTSRYARRGAVAVEHPGDSVRYLSVRDVSDLGKVGLTLDRYLHEVDDGSRPIVCFDSIPALVEMTSRERAFRFLHRITVHLREAGASAHYHSHPDEISPFVGRTFHVLFDEVVEADGIEEIDESAQTGESAESGVLSEGAPTPGEPKPEAHGAASDDGPSGSAAAERIEGAAAESIESAEGRSERSTLKGRLDRLWEDAYGAERATDSDGRSDATKSESGTESEPVTGRPRDPSGFVWLDADSLVEDPFVRLDAEDPFVWVNAASLVALPQSALADGGVRSETDGERAAEPTRTRKPGARFGAFGRGLRQRVARFADALAAKVSGRGASPANRVED